MIDISYFENVIIKDKRITLSDAESIILPVLRKIPAPVTDVSRNAYIERAVKVDRKEAPFDLSRLSYIPEYLKHKAKSGRFNGDEQPMFSGAFTDLDSPELTRYFLACEIEQKLLKTDKTMFRFTISK